MAVNFIIVFKNEQIGGLVINTNKNYIQTFVILYFLIVLSLGKYKVRFPIQSKQ